MKKKFQEKIDIFIRKILELEWTHTFYFVSLRVERSNFVENLAALLSAGLGVNAALYSMNEEIKSWRFRKVISFIISDVESGKSLSKALRGYGLLPEHILSLVETGEKSGRLVENLKIIVVQNEKDALFRSRLRSSVLYAGIIFTLAIIVLVGMAWFVLPKVAVFFESLDAELPATTRFLIGSGKFFEAYGSVIVPLFVILLALTVYFLFSFPRTRFIGHTLLFKTPLINSLIKQVEVARFGFLFGTMLESGMSVILALRNMDSTTTFKNYQYTFSIMRQGIEKGLTFKQIFSESPKFKRMYPAAVLQMIVAGEQSGTLSDSLIKVGYMYEKKTEATARNLPIILEPILLIFIAIIVGVIAFGILMPIYNLSFVIG